ncbi:MAG: DUF4438 domain-containing protein [Chloroflexi bacterium]|nr:DUF4438 domain-containing protein [Chloroflexota bacterium]
MLKIKNKEKLVKISVMGNIDAPGFPTVPWTPHFMTREGTLSLLPLNGGIVYNVRIGDPAMGWLAEVIEPGVSIRSKDAAAHRALKVFACLGNEAVVMSGRAKGAKGVVAGKSGRFMDHLILDFPPEAMETLAVGDAIQVRAYGLGAAIEGFPNVTVKNIDPGLAERMGIKVQGGKLQVPVVATLPAELMGAGAGLDSDGGALQLQTNSPGMVEEYGLKDLRLGDVIAVRDYDTTYAPGYLRGATSVGIVCHGDSVRVGFGPGLVCFLTGPTAEIEPVHDAKANMARIMGLGAFR